MKSKDHYERMGRLCEELKRISKEYGICILFPAQAPPGSSSTHPRSQPGVYIIDFLNNLAPCSHSAWDHLPGCLTVRCAYCKSVIPATEEHRKHIPFALCENPHCAQCSRAHEEEET